VRKRIEGKDLDDFLGGREVVPEGLQETSRQPQRYSITEVTGVKENQTTVKDRAIEITGATRESFRIL
jgi:hypothetical protein